MPAKICIVTPSHLAVSSRAVKEADALFQAGFDVTVVFGQGWSSTLVDYDQTILRSREWRWRAINWVRNFHRVRWGYTGLRQKLCRESSRVTAQRIFAPRLLGRIYPELTRAAVAERADLYIGHFPDGLAAAGKAAERTSALLAFDSEDFHLGEASPPLTQRAIEAIQGKYLPKCIYVSTSSEAIGKSLTEHYPAMRVLTIYNVFPLSISGPASDRGKCNVQGPLSLYWVSQTIGMDRGLQDAIHAVGMLEERVELHVRGNLPAEVEEALTRLAIQVGARHRVHFHPQIPPWDLLKDAIKYDVGLALEQPVNLNKELCVSIKLFLYLSAGLAIAATASKGQMEVLSQAPGAGELYPPGDYQSLAKILRRWQGDSAALLDAKQASLAAAHNHFNWDMESRKLVAEINHVLKQGNLSNETQAQQCPERAV